ncbi:hypothetical protein R5H30_15815 [Sulfitobacter sp. D35]|uniref:hypothetical protein n=1 Tax=Sulfitobacter sp. D35 TaxID=3083252 RepID=UPI00296FFA23|nr:hypothetical protein [Sulfitobacter sp. D35]MDW4499459.1 hypothetical protein [Sulfitobacter sp. D35]
MLTLKIAATAAAFTVSGWMGFTWLTGVTDPDIYAYHDVDFGTGSMTLNPGSIVAVSPRGKITAICRLKADQENITPGDLFTYVYYNMLREDFPEFIRAVVLTRDAIAGDTVEIEAQNGQTLTFSTPPRSGKAFTGREAQIQDLTKARTFAEEDCERQMAWHLSKGYKACTVLKALNAAVRDPAGNLRMKTVAVAFAEHSNFVMESKFEEEGIPYNDAARNANGKACDGTTLPWIAQLRNKLQVINRVEIAAST